MATQQFDLSAIKESLMMRRAALQQRHERVEHDLQRRFDPLVTDSDDRAIQLENDEVLHAIDDATLDELAAIDAALERLQLGRYGICKACGLPIEASRLSALHAVTCARCASD